VSGEFLHDATVITVFVLRTLVVLLRVVPLPRLYSLVQPEKEREGGREGGRESGERERGTERER
jgi:hypothetical protein